tara:strand:- start:366 stop:575 length:210 start_codon:yes stop_codon:yes gene_type:complete
MTTNNTNVPKPNGSYSQNNRTTTEIKWIGDEVLFKIGNTEVKIWYLIVGFIVLSILMRNGNGKKIYKFK